MPFPTYGLWTGNSTLGTSCITRVPQQQTIENEDSPQKGFPDFFMPCGAPTDNRAPIGHPRDSPLEKRPSNPVIPEEAEAPVSTPPIKFVEFWGNKNSKPDSLIQPSICG